MTEPTEAPKPKLTGKTIVKVSVESFDGCNLHPVCEESREAKLYDGEEAAPEASRILHEIADSLTNADPQH